MEAKKTPAAEPADWERALEGVDFPAAKVAIVRRVAETDGLDSEVHTMLERLPRDEYETKEGLAADVRALYVEDGFDPTNLPI